mmetsp:Transcript_65185/g.75790  ORF Transcript_65185/g.75790 Transcript_65185/m.75790 type:complete len:199 (+) Transcript_65185:34-630(+)
MFDYLIAVAVALVGLAVVFLLFNAIDSKETVTKVKSAPIKVKPAVKKPTKKERQALREEEEIIAKELAAATSGMHSDRRDAKVITLDEYRTTKKEKKEQREKVSGPVQTEFTAKQVASDKEQGFSVVKREAPAKKKVVSPVDTELSAKEQLDRKLGQFFRASEKKGKKKDYSIGGEKPVATEGGKVIITGNIAGSRTW